MIKLFGKKNSMKSSFNFIEFIKKNYIIILIILITIIGAFLRLYNINKTLTFLGDQGRDAIIVRNLLVKADPILIGPTTSVGKIQLGPFYYYFMAPWLLLFNFNPIGPAIGVALVGIITIPLLFYLTKKMFGLYPAVFATILFTFSDVVIRNTRFSWNPNIMPFFIILLIWSLYEVYVYRKYKFLVLSWVSYSIALQLHYMALLLGPFIVLIWGYVFYKEFRLNKDKHQINNFIKYWFIGLLLFLTSISPLILFDFRHNFINFYGFIEFFAKGHHNQNTFWQTIMSIEGRFYQIFGELLGFFSLDIASYYLRSAISILIVIPFLFALYKNKTNKAFHLLFSGVIISLIGLMFYSETLFEHYLGFFYPFTFIVAGVSLGFLYQKYRIAGKLFAICLLIFIIWHNIQFYDFWNPTGPFIDDVQATADIISNDAVNDKFNIILIDDTKDYRAMNYRYFLEVKDAKILDLNQFGNADYLYIISLNKIDDLTNIETREIEDFLGQRIKDFEKDKLNAKIIKTLKQNNNYWIYKIRK